MAKDALKDCSDEEIFRRIRRGERDLFGSLIRRYEREIFGYLRRFLGDETLADDVFQTTFLQVYLKSESFEDGRPFRPWLYTIATNQAIDALRKANRSQTLSLDESTNGDEGSLLEQLESRGDSPPELAEGAERKQQIREAVDRLPEPYRLVLVLAYFQGLKYRDIADVMSIPVGTVKSRLHAALLKLHELWAGTHSLPDG